MRGSHFSEFWKILSPRRGYSGGLEVWTQEGFVDPIQKTGHKKSGHELLHCPLKMSGWQDSNLRPLGPKPSAIPGYATPRASIFSLIEAQRYTFYCYLNHLNSKWFEFFFIFCDPGWNRTSNLLLRRQLLYPIELRDLFIFFNSFEHRLRSGCSIQLSYETFYSSEFLVDSHFLKHQPSQLRSGYDIQIVLRDFYQEALECFCYSEWLRYIPSSIFETFS